MTSTAKITVAPRGDSDLSDAQASYRLMLRHDRNAQLVRWMTFRSGEDRIAEHHFPGIARFTSGALVRVREAVDWPGALLGFRTEYDTEITPINAAGADLMRSWLPLIREDVFVWMEGDAQVVFRAALPCPICGHRTLIMPGCYEICTICGWEDDGWAQGRPEEVSGPNHVTPAQARCGYWERLGTEDERFWWRSLNPKPTFTADDHADAMMRVLRGCMTTHKARAVMRDALRRVAPAAERHAQALALAWDGEEDDADRARVFARFDAAVPMWVERQDHGGDDALSAHAAALGVDVGELLQTRAALLEVGRVLKWEHLRPLEEHDVTRLVNAEAWASLRLLAGLGWLRDRGLFATLSAELDAMLDEPDWTRWDPWYNDALARFVWEHVWDARSREALRARVTQAVADDDGSFDWLLEDIAALVGVPYNYDENPGEGA